MTTWASGFSDPIEMVFEDNGYAYVVDYGTGHVIKVSPDGLTKTTFATTPGAASITRDVAGNLYVAEYFNQKIDKITPAGVMTTYVALVGGSGDRLTMLSMDGDGTLYAGLLNPGLVYKIAPGGSPVTLFNNSMPSCLGFEKDAYGYWYSASYDGDQIFRISPGGAGAVFTGANATTGHVDGTLAAARFNWPCRPVLRGHDLYIPEWNGDDVRLIHLDQTSSVRNTSWGRMKELYR
jgi:DNA-binding beta-propeller fold protein YncE